MLQGKSHYLFINLCGLCKTADPTQPPYFPKSLIEVGEVEPGLLTQVCDSQLWVTEVGRFQVPSLGNLVRCCPSKMKKNWRCSSWNMVCTLMCTPPLLHLHKQIFIQLPLPIHHDDFHSDDKTCHCPP